MAEATMDIAIVTSGLVALAAGIAVTWRKGAVQGAGIFLVAIVLVVIGAHGNRLSNLSISGQGLEARLSPTPSRDVLSPEARTSLATAITSATLPLPSPSALSP